MILPGSLIFSILLLLLTLVCWGSWVNTFKAAGSKWRFELYYLDFAIGAFLLIVLIAMTFGSLGWDGFSFTDDLRLAGRRKDAFALAGGTLYNLANMLLVGSVSLCGVSVAFPIALGLGFVQGAIWNYVLDPQGSSALLFVGLVVVIASIVFSLAAYRADALTHALAAIAQGKAGSTKKTISLKGLLLAVASGLLMGTTFPMVQLARAGEDGLGPYALAFVFGLGLFLSTFVFSLFFMNLPVKGQPIDAFLYLKGKSRVHLLGLAGGGLWAVGLVCSLIPLRAEGSAHPGLGIDYALVQAAPIVAALWGLLYWKEFRGAEGKVKTYLTMMIVLFCVGLGLVSASPFYQFK